MSDTPDNLVLVLMREMRAEVTSGFSELRHGIREVRDRLHALEQGQVNVVRNLRQIDESMARERSELHGRVDNLTARIEKLERQAEVRD